ncbi:hypothetical protein SDC9_76202 [bioreactor metagenome]|uniref:Uncharacterized protein n=1 Tax=bioreactor metagenome TaxID=1076179 RepID=A0A644YM08_9ZZZZ
MQLHSLLRRRILPPFLLYLHDVPCRHRHLTVVLIEPGIAPHPYGCPGSQPGEQFVRLLIHDKQLDCNGGGVVGYRKENAGAPAVP